MTERWRGSDSNRFQSDLDQLNSASFPFKPHMFQLVFDKPVHQVFLLFRQFHFGHIVCVERAYEKNDSIVLPFFGLFECEKEFAFFKFRNPLLAWRAGEIDELGPEPGRDLQGLDICTTNGDQMIL